MQPPRQLAQQINDRDSKAWAAFVDAPGDAEDLTREVFVALYQSMARYRGEASVGLSFVIGIAALLLSSIVAYVAGIIWHA